MKYNYQRQNYNSGYGYDDNLRISAKREHGVVKSSTMDDLMLKMVRVKVDREPKSSAERDLVGDTLLSMLKETPKTVDEAEPGREVNKALVDWMLETVGDRADTINNIPASVITGGLMWTNLTQDSSIKEALERQRQAEEERKKAEELERQAMEQAQAMAKGGGGQGGMQKFDDLIAQAQAARDKAKELGQQGLAKIEKQKSDPIKQKAMNVAANKANEKAKQVKDMMAGWGIGSSTESADIELIEQTLSDREFAELSRLLGRAMGIAKSEFAKKRQDVKMSEVNFTKNIPSLFESEIANLTTAAPLWLRAKNVRQLMQTGLLGWKQLEETKESGSFIALVDESGSLGTQGCAVEKAIVLGVAKSIGDIEEGRHYEAYGFSGDIVSSITCDQHWKDHIAWARTYNGGGTRIGVALTKAFERIEALIESGVDGVDIFLLSDGIDYITDDVFEKLDEIKRQMSTRLIYINIGHYGGSDQLIERADRYITLGNVNDLKKSFEDITRQVAEMIATH